MTDNTLNQSWVKFDETDGSSRNNSNTVNRSQPINIDPKRINEDKYDGVLINLPIVEFIPKMVIFLNGLNSDFAFFATPRRLFQPPRLLER